MVESAFEFIRICEKHQYFNLTISMKASNTLVMVQAYRLLVSKMLENGRCYPLHLGVTEAGDGEDGRIKSAVGIGALLEDGIGDTIRVSLIRMYNGKSPFSPDQNHLHHILLKRGYSHIKITVTLAFCSIVLILIAILAQPLGNNFVIFSNLHR